jgi:hypothetical protein
MNDLFAIFMWLNGILLGYVLWAPLTPFKQGFIDGITLKFLWDKFKKVK